MEEGWVIQITLRLKKRAWRTPKRVEKERFLTALRFVRNDGNGFDRLASLFAASC
jgi:hypothetical protein